MTDQDFLAMARSHLGHLTDLIRGYHPSSRDEWADSGGLPITAPAAEGMAISVRSAIAEKEKQMAVPEERFQKAIEDGDAKTAYQLLQSAWFGVPESTSCWGIPGFKALVDMLDDPPDSILQSSQSN